MPFREDCFAFEIRRSRAVCNALTELNCTNCKFYKTEDEYKKELKKYGMQDHASKKKYDKTGGN